MQSYNINSYIKRYLIYIDLDNLAHEIHTDIGKRDASTLAGVGTATSFKQLVEEILVVFFTRDHNPKTTISRPPSQDCDPTTTILGPRSQDRNPRTVPKY